MGDHGIANSARGSWNAWPGDIGDAVEYSGLEGASVSDALEGNEGQGEVSWVCWSNSATQSAFNASPVKSSIGALPCRLPLL